MGPLSALLLATPIFGLSLSIGGLEPGLPPASPPFGLDVPALVAPIVPEIAAPQDAASQVAPPQTDTPPPVTAPTPDVAPTPAEVTPPPAVAPSPTVTAASDTSEADEERYEHDLRQRTSIAKIHRILGISTWISMGATLLLGGFQFHNLYGEWNDINHNPCVTGKGLIFGPDQCYGVPWIHAISEGVTTALYFTTFTLSLLMPDPDHADQGNGAFAERLRWHKILRWIHLGGMITQIVLGLIIANIGGRSNNYDTLEALATVHMGVGIATYGALTAAGALMTF